MNRLTRTILFSITLALVALSTASTPATRDAHAAMNHVVTTEPAKCSPSGTCRACKNCKYCKHCNEGGGTCSVCR